MDALFDMTSSRSRNRWLALAAAAVMAGAMSFAGLNTAAAETPAPAATTADAMFAASFKDPGGTVQKFDNLKGKVSVVYFWATWCEPCQKEAPQLKALFEKYRDKGFEVVGIAMDNADKVKDFVAKNQLTFTVVYGGREAMQLSKDLGNSLGGIPFLVVIGKDGKIVERLTGETKDGRVEGIVAPLLGG
jgi:thiol-disulfide isomerase/thioredoxin